MPPCCSSLPQETKDKLAACAKAIVANGRGILAADESVPTVGKRFDGIKLENNEENRRRFREMLFTADNASKFFGGIIFFDESIHQKDSKGTSFVELCKKANVKVGIKVDKGLTELPGGCADEKFTKGMDDLKERCANYAKLGAEFAKWRCVLVINKTNCTPSELSIDDVSFTLARYARICQENGLVPIVEPEILLDGDHDLETCQKITEKTLTRVYRQLQLHNVFLEGTLLKPNMVTPGVNCATKYTPEDIAKATVTALMRSVPPAVPGVTFLSGGQSEMNATLHLNEINKYAKKVNAPWRLTFSFARALQNSAVNKWNGKDETLAAGQEVLALRAGLNSQASLGTYDVNMETDKDAQASLFVAKHTY